jgi:hypothetical protein
MDKLLQIRVRDKLLQASVSDKLLEVRVRDKLQLKHGTSYFKSEERPRCSRESKGKAAPRES